MAMKVILGTEHALHTGLHGALLRRPPPGVEYSQRSAIHEIVLPSIEETLFSAQGVSEAVNFGSGSEVVHSAQWPVVGRKSWVVDYEDFGSAAFLSHFGLSPQCGECELSAASRTPAFAAQLSMRFANLVRALGHPSCKAVFCHTSAEGDKIRRWLAKCSAQREADLVHAKLRVLHPAVPPIDVALAERKWSTPTRLRLVYCGQGFEAKRGLWALRVFVDLAKHPNVERCTFVGDVPENARREFLGQSTIEHHRALTHGEVLDLFARAHVLVHPSDNESVGAVVLEACAAGMCVVARSGYGMEHLGEWFSGGGAFLAASEAADSAAAEARFHYEVLQCVEQVQRARDYAMLNHARSTHGPWSLSARQSALLEAYSARPARSPVSMRTFHLPPQAHVLRCTSAYLVQQRRPYLLAMSDGGRQNTFVFDL